MRLVSNLAKDAEVRGWSLPGYALVIGGSLTNTLMNGSMLEWRSGFYIWITVRKCMVRSTQRQT
jgi:hypothetical protein